MKWSGSPFRSWGQLASWKKFGRRGSVRKPSERQFEIKATLESTPIPPWQHLAKRELKKHAKQVHQEILDEYTEVRTTVAPRQEAPYHRHEEALLSPGDDQEGQSDTGLTLLYRELPGDHDLTAPLVSAATSELRISWALDPGTPAFLFHHSLPISALCNF